MNIVQLDAFVSKPATVRTTGDSTLFIVCMPAAERMAILMRDFGLSRDGQTWQEPCEPHEVAAALRGWLLELGRDLVHHSLLQHAGNVASPIPFGCDRDQAARFFTGDVMPSPQLLVHVLWSIGLTDTTISGAVALWHACQADE